MSSAGDIIRAIGRDPAGDFILGGASRARIVAMAAALTPKKAASYCLASTDRELIAAAVLARLMGGPPLILPPSLATRDLDQLARSLPGLVLLTAAETITGQGAALQPNHHPGAPGQQGDESRGQHAGTVPGFHINHDCLQRELVRIFTGGSTGLPRIWPKTGMNLLGEALFLCQHFQITPADRILATVPPYHIYGLLFSVLVPLVSGATVLPQQPAFPEEIRTATREHKATILVSVPPHYQAIASKPLAAPCLRLAFSSAGPLGEAENQDFTRHNQVPVIEVFGSTETGGIGSRNRFAGEEGFTPFAPVAWREKDGLLLVRSPFLSPELPVDQDGWFRTSDRVRSLGKGVFLPLGRADSIAKVGGKRVDLEEIRTTIRDLAEVRDCVVLSLPDAGGRGERIAALIAGNTDPASLKAQLAGRLPPHAMPRIIRVVANLPTQANGKIDRQAILDILDHEQN